MASERLNILLIANSSGSIGILRNELEASGTRCRLLTIGAGPATLPYLRREGPYAEVPKPDLILFDLADAATDALAVVRRIKRNGLLRKIPIVLLTPDGEPLPEDIDIGQERYTTFSPVDLDSFLGALNAITPDRFMEAIALLEEFGFVLVRMPQEVAATETRTGTYQ